MTAHSFNFFDCVIGYRCPVTFNIRRDAYHQFFRNSVKFWMEFKYLFENIWR